MSEETITPNEYQPRLLIYVVWHPEFECEENAERCDTGWSRPTLEGGRQPVVLQQERKKCSRRQTVEPGQGSEEVRTGGMK